MRPTLPAILLALAASVSIGSASAQTAPGPTVTVKETPSAPATPDINHPVNAPDPPPPANEPMWQAEAWAESKTSPWLTAADSDVEKKKHKGPVRSFVKAVAKGTAKELGTSFSDMAKDMVLVFSVQDIDPYDQSKGPPPNRPAIVLKMDLVDGTSCYLRRFPDGSYAVEDGYANGTVLLPRKETRDYLVKYPNGFQGRMVKSADGNIVIYRPDRTETIFKKNASGGYTATNSKLGYMGEARPDDTGVQYEVGAW
jgi:hypothetical protein